MKVHTLHVHGIVLHDKWKPERNVTAYQQSEGFLPSAIFCAIWEAVPGINKEHKKLKKRRVSESEMYPPTVHPASDEGHVDTHDQRRPVTSPVLENTY